MPTPEHIRAASRKKRERICVICGAHFVVRKVDHIGLTCSKPCLSEQIRQRQLGHKQRPESIAKRSASMKVARADPERREKWRAATAEGIAKWHTDPANAAVFARRSSERMKRRHADPDWQKVRDERSSRTMKATWEKHRDTFTAQAIERYAAGLGINSEDSKRRKNEAAKWILKKAQHALHTETNYDQVYADVQARLRREFPYDGPKETSDYYDYLKKLGSLVTSSPECRTLSDTFLSGAIPQFAAEWRKRAAQGMPPTGRDGLSGSGPSGPASPVAEGHAPNPELRSPSHKDTGHAS